MYSYMPSIKCPSNNGLSEWKTLWANQGVCSGLNQTYYFKSSLLLRSTINLLPRLKRLGKEFLRGRLCFFLVFTWNVEMDFTFTRGNHSNANCVKILLDSFHENFKIHEKPRHEMKYVEFC